MVDDLEQELRHFRGQYHLIDKHARPSEQASAILKLTTHRVHVHKPPVYSFDNLIGNEQPRSPSWSPERQSQSAEFNRADDRQSPR